MVVPKFELEVDLCNPCAWAVGSCGLSVVGGPIADVIGVWQLIVDCLIDPDPAGCLEGLAGEIPGLGQALTAKDCVCNIAESCLSQTTAGRFVAQQCQGLDAWAQAGLALLGNPVWLRQDPVDQGLFESFWNGFSAATGAVSEEGARVSEAELAGLLVLARPRPVEAEDVSAWVGRWNRTLEYRAQGITNLTQLLDGMSADFIALDRLASTWAAARAGLEANLTAGYPNLYEAALTAVALARAESAPQEGACARVSLRLDQDAVLSRDAFNGTLEIDNRSGSLLTDLSVSVEIRDGAGRLANELFGIELVESNWAGGVLLPNTRGRGVWMIVPTPQAAWESPTEYWIGGRLSYGQDGQTITVPLFPALVTVWPTARLQMHYFLEREVYSDDPFTEGVEPAEPFALGLLVHNAGGGSARNMVMRTSEPYITANERDLLIDFQILSAQVCDQEAASALTLSLGDVAPGGTAVATWWLSASLQGRFLGLEASYEHVDDLGNPNLTLVESLQTHDLIHVVQDERAGSDTCPDYLVDEVADLNGLADTIYLSDGTVGAVTALSAATVTGAPSGTTVLLSAAMPSGWGYLKVADPGQGVYRLVGVYRTNDNSALLLGKNVWTTHRTVRPLGEAPRREDWLHLLDYDSAGAYWLVYEPIPVDVLAPTSQVAALPGQSYPEIPVSWSGQDNAGGSGIAYYNIFVSSDGGAFVLWQSQTRQTGATFLGTMGSSYAFYSVAVDGAGNREEPPGTPDAQTTVSLSNRPPWLEQIADLTLSEGDVLVIHCVATNAETPPQTLSFSLAVGPPGAVMDSERGVLRWATGEAHGDGTYPVTVCVADNGLPPLEACQSFTVYVRDSNSVPVLEPVGLQVVKAGEPLEVVHQGFDPDLPKQALRFSLGAVSSSHPLLEPANAELDSLTGLFRWTPGVVYAGTTNTFEVILGDNGSPALSARQTLVVIVNEPMALGLGRTNVLVGQEGQVPLTVYSSGGVTEIESRLHIRPGHLTQVQLGPVGDTVCWATVVGDGTNGDYQLRVATCAGKRLVGTEQIGLLSFGALTNRSAFVPLGLSEVRAVRADGQVLSSVLARDGRVVVIGQERLLEAWLATNQQRMVSLYGQPGASYQITWTNRLVAWTNWALIRTIGTDTLTHTASAVDLWTPAWLVPMTGMEARFALPQDWGTPAFFSAFEFQADPPMVQSQPGQAGQPGDLWLFGMPGQTCQVQSTADLTGQSGWTTLATLTLTNSFHRLEGVVPPDQQLLFRAVKQ